VRFAPVLFLLLESRVAQDSSSAPLPAPEPIRDEAASDPYAASMSIGPWFDR